MQKIFLIIVMSQLCLTTFAQKAHTTRKAEKRKRISNIIKQEEEGVIVYHHQTVFGLKLINDGYGGFFEYGRSQSIKKSILFQLEVSERKSPKEEKQVFNNYSFSPIIYGKRNFVYPIKLGVQVQNLLGNKSNKNGVSITANYGGGISLALIRPYLIQQNKNGVTTYIGYNSPDSLIFLDQGDRNRAGGPNLSTGWNKATVTPGIFAKTALRFDYGTYNEIVSALEVGLTGEFYTKKIPIMAHIPAKQFFLSVYASILFGKRK